ncbi:hypothetical protein B0H19DRAFT_1232707 [Mycena capillaripes]|nr:hypothetical protein B0H19DRAFT_1232707 [Mycena capillaripes]
MPLRGEGEVIAGDRGTPRIAFDRPTLQLPQERGVVVHRLSATDSLTLCICATAQRLLSGTTVGSKSTACDCNSAVNIGIGIRLMSEAVFAVMVSTFGPDHVSFFGLLLPVVPIPMSVKESSTLNGRCILRLASSLDRIDVPHPCKNTHSKPTWRENIAIATHFAENAKPREDAVPMDKSNLDAIVLTAKAYERKHDDLGTESPAPKRIPPCSPRCVIPFKITQASLRLLRTGSRLPLLQNKQINGISGLKNTKPYVITLDNFPPPPVKQNKAELKTTSKKKSAVSQSLSRGGFGKRIRNSLLPWHVTVTSRIALALPPSSRPPGIVPPVQAFRGETGPPTPRYSCHQYRRTTAPHVTRVARSLSPHYEFSVTSDHTLIRPHPRGTPPSPLRPETYQLQPRPEARRSAFSPAMNLDTHLGEDGIRETGPYTLRSLTTTAQFSLEREATVWPPLEVRSDVFLLVSFRSVAGTLVDEWDGPFDRSFSRFALGVFRVDSTCVFIRTQLVLMHTIHFTPFFDSALTYLQILPTHPASKRRDFAWIMTTDWLSIHYTYLCIAFPDHQGPDSGQRDSLTDKQPVHCSTGPRSTTPLLELHCDWTGLLGSYRPVLVAQYIRFIANAGSTLALGPSTLKHSDVLDDSTPRSYHGYYHEGTERKFFYFPQWYLEMDRRE